MKFCARLPDSSPTYPPIFLQQNTLNPDLQKLSSLWEGGGIIFSSEWMEKALRNIFPLGCGTCLCFVRERCHLSVCEMGTKYLLLPFGGLQGLMDEKFCVHGICAVSSVHLSQSCFTLIYFSFFFQIRAKPSCSDSDFSVLFGSFHHKKKCSEAPSHVVLMFSFDFPLL